MADSYTRLQLRSPQTASSNFTAQAYTFTLENNLSQTAYFALEGKDYYNTAASQSLVKDVFNSSSITSLTNCSVVTGSVNAGFIIDSGSTATFVFTPTSTINKDQVKFSAPNSLVYNNNFATSSGVNLAISP